MTTEVHTLLGVYVLDAVDDEERRLVEQHITECETCAQEVRELRATAARLADFTVVEPPSRLKEAVMAAVRRTRQLPPLAKTEPEAEEVLRPKQIRPWRRAFVAAAAALVLALAGGAIGFAVMQNQLSEERAHSAQVNAVLTASDAQFTRAAAEGGGDVSMVSSKSRNQAVVILSGLSEITADQSYQLWLVTEDDQRSVGVLAAGQNSGTHLVEGINSAEVFGVTAEPAGGSDSPTLPMVAGMELPG